jgi:hypothetical protein
VLEADKASHPQAALFASTKPACALQGSYCVISGSAISKHDVQCRSRRRRKDELHRVQSEGRTRVHSLDDHTNYSRIYTTLFRRRRPHAQQSPADPSSETSLRSPASLCSNTSSSGNARLGIADMRSGGRSPAVISIPMRATSRLAEIPCPTQLARTDGGWG